MLKGKQGPAYGASTLLVLCLALGTSTAAAASGFVVIASKSAHVSELSAEEVSQIFLKKTSRWEDGTKIIPVDRSEKSAVRRSFTRRVHDRSVAAIRMHWSKLIFSGRGVPPREVRSDAEAVAFVRDHPGAIGYVSVGSPTEGTTVVRLK